MESKDRAAREPQTFGPIFTALFEAMNEGVALCEAVLGPGGRPADYRILEVNPAFERLTGLQRTDIAGRLASEVYGSTPPPQLDAFCSVPLTCKPLQFEAPLPPTDRHFHLSVTPLGPLSFATILTDITDRIRRIEEINRQSLAVHTILENQPFMAWLKDKDGRFITVNNLFAKACGQPSPEAMVGKTDFDVWPGSLAEGYVKDDREIMRSRCPKTIEEVIHEEGQDKWFETFKSPILDAQGEVIGSTGFARDISERKRAEEERLKLEKQMMQTQKLESLGILAGGIAHDFNNLLTSILGNADLALCELAPINGARERLEDIVLAGRRAADLCRQMLAYSGKGHFVIQAFSVNEMVEEMGHLLSVSISKKAALQYNLSPGLPSVMADATQLRQVVMNLITNASEAIGDRNGVITVTTGTMDCDPDYLQSVTRGGGDLAPGPYIFLEVSDTGCGMDKETLDRIFDPFFTTKFTGRGLGLAAVLGIVRGHKGGLRVYSEKGKGTSFKILLPVHGQPAKPILQAPSRSDGWRGHGMVLLVDDEETIRSTGRRILEKCGFTVSVASDGEEAVRVFKEHQREVRLVVMDMTMPRLDGEACFREMRRLEPKVKVIMTSGYNEQDVINRFAGKGLAGFVQKPYTSGDILPKIQEALGE